MPAGLLMQGSDPAGTCSRSSKGQEILLTAGPSGFLLQSFFVEAMGTTTSDNAPAQLLRTSQKAPEHNTTFSFPLHQCVFVPAPHQFPE